MIVSMKYSVNLGRLYMSGGREQTEEDKGGLGGSEKKKAYRLYMSDTMSISASACAIFCSEESCGLPPKRKDILNLFSFRDSSLVLIRFCSRDAEFCFSK